MDEQVLIWLALLAILLLRRIVGKKRPPAGKNIAPGVGSTLGDPLADRTVIDGRLEDTRTSSGPPQRSHPPVSEFEQSLAEIKTALGITQPIKPQRDVEAFGTSEQLFEAEAPYRDYSSSSENRFEARPVSFVSASDSEDAFEREDGFSKKAVFYDDAFDKKSTSSEVSFQSSWHGHDSDFEYHSALEKPKKIVSSVKTIPVRAATPSPLRRRLMRSSDLQMAVIMHEILGSPVSLRTPSPRHHPS